MPEQSKENNRYFLDLGRRIIDVAKGIFGKKGGVEEAVSKAQETPAKQPPHSSGFYVSKEIYDKVYGLDKKK